MKINRVYKFDSQSYVILDTAYGLHKNLNFLNKCFLHEDTYFITRHFIGALLGVYRVYDSPGQLLSFLSLEKGLITVWFPANLKFHDYFTLLK